MSPIEQVSDTQDNGLQSASASFPPIGWLVALQVCTSLTLASRGWLTWRWDSPIRALVWQEDWWSGPLERCLSVPWSELARHSEPTLTRVLEATGLVLLFSATIPLLLAVERLRWTRWLLLPPGLVLAMDATARWVEKDWEFAMSIEHALQACAPFALIAAFGIQNRWRGWWQLVAAATSLTFVGHGLYALGFHAVPLNFQNMTMAILKCDQEVALAFLQMVGWLDLVAAAGVWFTRTRKWSLIYMIGWGAATAFARIWAHEGFDPWLAESWVRTPHWVFPILLLFSHPRHSSPPANAD